VRALEEAADRAEERGGHLAAARALVRAAELSSDPAVCGAHLQHAAWVTSLAGRDDEAVAIAGRAAPFADEPLQRARLAQVRGLAAMRRGSPQDVVALLIEAARGVAAPHPAVALEILMLASSAAWQSGDRPAYAEIAKLAGDVVAPPGDDRSAFIHRALTGYAAMIEGDTETGTILLTETIEWGSTSDEPLLVYWAGWGAIWLQDEGRFGELVSRAMELARARGELGTLTYALGAEAARNVLGQRYDDALVAATEAVQFARELGAINLEVMPRGVIAVVEAIRGGYDETRLHGERALAVASANRIPLRATLAVYALGLADLGRGRWGEALQRLDGLVASESGTLDPLIAATLPDAVEAAVRAGRPERASVALAVLEEWGAQAGPAPQARIASCRALLCEGDQATRHHKDAVARRESAPPFDMARINLLYGEHLRRERQRTQARIPLREALESFERLGAVSWAERARGELRATGEVSRKRDPSTIDQLTPQELQVARLVSEGLSNKDVAAQLFLSPRTIDSHLRNVFSKLGVTSRTQLARLPLGVDEPVPKTDRSRVGA
jgi:ATP/maltotriose-dependent transcriptional regulator MalT